MLQNDNHVNHTNRTNTIDSKISRAAACRLLKVTPPVLERLAQTRNVGRYQVPGHSRIWFSRSGIEALANEAVKHMGAGA